MIWLRSIRDVTAELIGAATATLYPLDAQVRVTETQEVPMAQAPKVVIPVEFDFTEARKQLAEFCGHDTPQRVMTGFDAAKLEGIGMKVADFLTFDGSRSSDEVVTAELRPNYHEDTRLVDIVAAMLHSQYLGSAGLDRRPWVEEKEYIKNSWRRAAAMQLKEMNR